ncbi:MAG: hypothetical protein U0359_08160 [Byssovorax sp.]
MLSASARTAARFIAILGLSCAGLSNASTCGPTPSSGGSPFPTATGTGVPTSPTSTAPPPCGSAGASCEPPPAPGHPRLWVKASDLPRLRAWATPKNPIYVEIAKIAEERFLKQDLDNPATDNPGPAVKTVKKDEGADTYQSDPTSEEYARLFAFMALVSPDPQKRHVFATRAHDLLMKVISAAEQCPKPKQKGNAKPYCSTDFLLRDRANFQGDAYATVLDWIYPYFSKSEKARIQKVYLGWADELTHAMTTTGNHPEPVGVFNDPSLLAPEGKLRWAGNNYFAGHMKNLGLLALALDAEDDPPSGDKPEGVLGSTARSYLDVAVKAYLYMTDAFYRHGGRKPDPSGAAQDFRGAAPEGSLYGQNSLGFAAQLYLALHTAGKDDAAALGPQVRWDNHPHWDRAGAAYLSMLEPWPSLGDGYVGKGSYYQVAAFGEVNYETVVVDPMLLFGPRGVWAYDTGHADELNLIRFLEKNVPPGGADLHMTRVQKTPNIHSTLDAIFAFLLFDPTPAAPPITDPRPSLPLDYHSPALGRILSRTSWGTEASFFTYKLGWLSIDHQNPDGNQIELYRKGQWLTKGLVGYGPNVALSHHHNTMAVQNSLPHDTYKGDLQPSNTVLYPSYRRGSQWLHGAAGEPAVTGPSLDHPEFIAVTGDATPLYNLSLGNTTASDITHVSRSVVWIKPDHVIVYDRATSKSDGRFKRFFLNTQTLPSVPGGKSQPSSGSDADLGPAGTPMITFTGAVPQKGLVTTALVHPVANKQKGGPSPEQQLFVTTLLPEKIVLRASSPEELGKEPLTVDPMKFVLSIEADGGPTDARFLHVLEGADAGKSADPAMRMTVNQTSAPLSPYDGALVKGTVVLFARRLGEGFNGMSYTAPAGTKHIITGLPANAAFSVNKDGAGKVTLTPGGALQSDGGGVLVF